MNIADMNTVAGMATVVGESRARRLVVAAGPTITAAEVRRVVPGAEVVGPIAFGHAAGYGLRAGDSLLVIDGLFLQQPSVRHKELLGLLDAGVRVAGCSSMGALRAAELAPFGMRGYGRIYEDYRTGRLRADDEVALVHGPAEDGWPVLVDALVNIRATLTSATTSGLITPEQAEAIVEAARGLPFTHRGWQQLLPAAGIPTGQVPALAARLRAARVDAKHADAITALAAVSRFSPTSTRPHRPVPVLSIRPPATLWTEHWTATTTRSSRAQVTDAQVLVFLKLFSADHWTILPALEQYAAWHHDTISDTSTDSVGGTVNDVGRGLSVAERADRAVAALGPTAPADRQHALGLVAHQYMRRRGLITDAGWPASVLADYLDPDELTAAAEDPVVGSRLLAPRVLYRQPLLPDSRHLTHLIRTDPRWEDWAQHAARFLAVADQLATEHPELDLSRPDPDLFEELFSKLWSTSHLRAELGRRGFPTREAFHAAAGPFAAAAATETWPDLHVGAL